MDEAGKPIDVLVIGGSGAYDFPEEAFGLETGRLTVETPFGPSAPVRILRCDNRRVGFLSRHGESGYNRTAPFVNYRANIYAAKALGVQQILSWSGPGAIHEALHPGDLVIPDDLIDLTRQRPLTFFKDRGVGFIRQNPVFCPEIREALQGAVVALNRPCLTRATYVCTEGPRLETPAEIRYMKRIGGDLVGMTLVPEAFLARELEICYAALCYISNYAEGVRDLPYEKGVLFEGTLPEPERHRVEGALFAFPRIVRGTLRRLASMHRECPCKDAMLRYRMRGDIGDDWRTWIV